MITNTLGKVVSKRSLMKATVASTGVAVLGASQTADSKAVGDVDVVLERGIKMLTSDGETLITDVIRPANKISPALLVRTPYGRSTVMQKEWLNGLTAASHGFAYVCQDQRGRGESSGKPNLFGEGKDGYQAVEWVAGQSWCDGNVGMLGASNMGVNSILTAMEQPPSLKAIAPIVATDVPGSGGLLTDNYHVGGVFRLAYELGWALKYGLKTQGPVGDLDASGAPIAFGHGVQGGLEWTLPLVGVDEIAKTDVATMLNYPDPNSHPWDKIHNQWSYQKILVPSLTLSGWYDFVATGNPRFHNGMKNEAGTEYARTESRLIMGPWGHVFEISPHVGSLSFGYEASATLVVDPMIQFFKRHLVDPQTPDRAPVTYFLMGRQKWVESETWPPAEQENMELYLTSEGNANLWPETGELSKNPVSHEGKDRYQYDPMDPAPMIGGRAYRTDNGPIPGPFDQTRIHRRNDCVVFYSDTLQEPVTVAGEPTLILNISSSALDTDFIAYLLDVQPDGTPINVADGAIRARFREGLSSPKLLEPGKIVQVEIGLGSTANQFRIGHKIGVHITSSAFPAYDRNMNTGNKLMGVDTEGVVAINAIHHGAEYKSRLLLPKIPS